MPDVVAKTMAFLCGLLLAGTVTALYVTSRPAAGANEVVAEFQDAFPLLEGMFVRVDGSIAGSVGSVEVNDEGLAEVTLILDEAIEDPSSNATAAIRQQDTTGDSYVAFEPGDTGEPLPEVDGMPTIECNAESEESPCQATLTAPRFDDLLNAFGPAERAGVKLILLELSRALDERGDDVNAAALELRPAMVSANQALGEVQSQNAALRSVIEDAEDMTGQAASKREELAGLIGALDTTLRATQAEAGSLDAGLDRLPETTVQVRTTMGKLRRATEAGVPLARELEARAPQLATAIDLLPNFLDAAEVALDRAEPTLELTRKLVRAGAPTIKADPQRVVTGPFDLAPAVSNLLTGVLGDENTIKGLFGDDSLISGGTGTLDGFGLGAVGVEPGNQPAPGYGPAHTDRYFMRLSAVFNCTMFGVPVAPGCLSGVILPRGGARNEAAADRETQGPSDTGETAPDAGVVPDVRDPFPDVGDLPGVDPGELPGNGAAKDLMDFLFKP